MLYIIQRRYRLWIIGIKRKCDSVGSVIYPRHKALVDSFAKEGKIIAIGTFQNIADGSMGIFQNKEYAEEFVKQDPFVLEGVVGKLIIREWNEILLG
jgi:uncharacterized protein